MPAYQSFISTVK